MWLYAYRLALFYSFLAFLYLSFYDSTCFLLTWKILPYLLCLDVVNGFRYVHAFCTILYYLSLKVFFPGSDLLQALLRVV